MKKRVKVHKVTIFGTDIIFNCHEDEYLFAAMHRAGVIIQSGCRGGGCGICKVRLIGGEVSRETMSREHISEADESAGFLLSCRVKPLSDLVLDNF